MMGGLCWSERSAESYPVGLSSSVQLSGDTSPTQERSLQQLHDIGQDTPRKGLCKQFSVPLSCG